MTPKGFLNSERQINQFRVFGEEEEQINTRRDLQRVLSFQVSLFYQTHNIYVCIFTYTFVSILDTIF